MAVVRRSRTLRATPQEIWAVVGDAHHLPRWWPRVTRVEDVRDGAFTQVLRTAKGAPVRADFEIVESDSPRVRRWAQQLVNTPFERVLAQSEVEVRLEPEGRSATRVELSLVQRLNGTARLGAFMVRSAGRRQLDDALDGLEQLVGAR
ncbi:MAG: SRPBCC family protein [Thermoleophilia bacterium]